MRVAPKATLTDEQRGILQRWARGRTTPARLVRRAQIVLLAAEGRQNEQIATELSLERTIVGRWRQRFASQGLAGIEKDAPRGGRPPTARQEAAARIIDYTTQRRPANATHWSTTTLARELGVSQSMVSRVWRANGLQPHRIRTFKVSNDPQFVAKLVERWFREITDKRIRRSSFHNVRQLIAAIEAYLAAHIANPRSLVWTAKTDTLLAKVRRARAVLDKMQTA